jgi:hypothetical protein
MFGAWQPLKSVNNSDYKPLYMSNAENIIYEEKHKKIVRGLGLFNCPGFFGFSDIDRRKSVIILIPDDGWCFID